MKQGDVIFVLYTTPASFKMQRICWCLCVQVPTIYSQCIMQIKLYKIICKTLCSVGVIVASSEIAFGHRTSVFIVLVCVMLCFSAFSVPFVVSLFLCSCEYGLCKQVCKCNCTRPFVRPLIAEVRKLQP